MSDVRGRELTVLHVDDDRAFVDLTTAFLERVDGAIEVESTHRPSDALDRLDRGDVDCVVSDYEMTGMDGLALLESVRDRYPDLPFVLFTGKGDEAVAGRAIRAGATDYLQKDSDSDCFALLANRVRNAVATHRSTRRAQRLDRTRTLIGEINQALLRADSRDEIENQVCSLLTDADPYRFAWIGAVDESTSAVVPRASGGDGVGYLEGVTITADESPTGRGPTGEAIRTGQLVVNQQVTTAPTYEPWRADALDREFRSSAAIPLEYDGTCYGVVNLYADRPEAFTEAEQSLLSEVGENVAHAIDRVETKAALRAERRRRQTFLDALHDSIGRMLHAETREAVASVTAEVADTTLGHQDNAVLLHEAADSRLHPVSSASGISALDGASSFPVDRGPVGGAFSSGKSVVIDDLGDDTAGRLGTARSAMIVPIGSHGVFVALETTANAFDEPSRTLASVLAANAETAFSRLDREQELLEKSTLLDQLFEQVPIHLYVKDDQARHLRVSTAFLDPAEILGKTDREYYDTDFAEETYADDRRVIETGEPILDKEEQDPNVGGWHLTSKVPWYDESGDIAGLIGVTRNITARKEYRHQLERQNDRLDEFASIVSHDLRNPLNVAEGQLALARETGDRDHLRDVQAAHDRMKRLIDDLLALAREGDTTPTLTSVALADTARACWRSVEAPTAHLAVETDCRIEADRNRLVQLFENLFRNAVEHGGPTVTVTVTATEGGFAVADDGPGIDPADRDTVFERGYTTSTDGTGYGLTIVDRIAEAHGWDVEVGEASGGGAKFSFTCVNRLDE